MTWNPAGERKLFEQALHPFLILAYMGIDLAVSPLKVRVRHQSRPAMPWPSDVQNVQVLFLDYPVQVGINKVKARRGAPMTQQPWFDVL
jgi:hypothetical protein